MKLRLSPTLSYLIGMWKHSRTREGIGIVGNDNMKTAFLAKVVEAQLTPADQVKVEENAVFFYHTAYRAFFDEIVKEQVDRFCHANDFAAAFLAGWFDAVGGIEAGKVYLTKWDKQDEMVLLRLNFQTEKADKRLWVGPAEMFLKFIKNWSQVSRPKTRKVVSDREGPILRMAAARKHAKEKEKLNEAVLEKERKEAVQDETEEEEKEANETEKEKQEAEMPEDEKKTDEK